MSATREELHDLIEQLPEGEVALARRFLRFLSEEAIGDEFAASIRRGISQANSGQTTEFGSYDEMVEKLLPKE